MESNHSIQDRRRFVFVTVTLGARAVFGVVYIYTFDQWCCVGEYKVGPWGGAEGGSGAEGGGGKGEGGKRGEGGPIRGDYRKKRL